MRGTGGKGGRKVSEWNLRDSIKNTHRILLLHFMQEKKKVCYNDIGTMKTEKRAGP